MPISDDEVQELLGSVEEIRRETLKHGRTLYGDDEYPGLRKIVSEVRLKTDTIDDKIAGWENKIAGAKWVIGGIAFLLTSGALAGIINLATGG